MKKFYLPFMYMAAMLSIAGMQATAQTIGTTKSAKSTKTKESKETKESKSATVTITEDMDIDNENDNEQIIIRRKGEKDVKVVVEIKGPDIKINGKPISQFKDDNISITKSKVMVYDGRALARMPRAYVSPYRSGTFNFENETLRELTAMDSRAFLGVITEKDSKGAKIKEITKGSAASKAGLKEDDIITKVDEIAIDDPEDLSRAIGKYKPEEKVTVTFLRDNKEQKLTVALGKRSSGATLSPMAPFNENWNFDYNQGNGLNYSFNGKPRLGIKAQDTEDGKGVKVLDVQDESAAAKAGIKEGDIITDFNEKPITSADELVEQAHLAKDKPGIKVKLLRAGVPQDIEIKIPKKLKTANL